MSLDMVTRRLPVLLAVASGLVACVVPDPIESEAPQRTPPILNLGKAKPFIGSVVVINRSAPNSFNGASVSVPVRSDDRGEPIHFALYLNYGLPDEFSGGPGLIEPSTIDDLSRKIEISLQFESRVITPGCRQLTLLVAHRDNWDFHSGRPKVPEAAGDTAAAMWWLNIDPPSGQESTLLDCPSRTTSPP
jgi:hypothetical protein